jgi:hypothetical protein
MAAEGIIEKAGQGWKLVSQHEGVKMQMVC